MINQELIDRVAVRLSANTHWFKSFVSDDAEQLRQQVNDIRRQTELKDGGLQPDAFFQPILLLLFYKGGTVQISVSAKPVFQVQQVMRHVSKHGYELEKIVWFVPMWNYDGIDRLPEYLYRIKERSRMLPRRHGLNANELRFKAVQALFNEKELTFSTVGMGNCRMLDKTRQAYPLRFTREPGHYTS